MSPVREKNNKKDSYQESGEGNTRINISTYDRYQESIEEYKISVLNDFEQKVSINKNKIQQDLNPYKENNLPDWVYTKAKEAVGALSSTSMISNHESTNNLVVSGSGPLKNTQLAWLTTMIVGNAIAMSDGQSNMRIDEEKVDWNQVFETTKMGFQNNMQQDHLNDEADKYLKYLNSPDSPYYFFSDEQKHSMVEQFKKDNYSLNKICSDVLESLIRMNASEK